MSADDGARTDPPPAGDADRVRLELLAQLVPCLVHELNNSLAVLRGVLDILVQDTGDASGRRVLEESGSSARLLARLSSLAKDDVDAVAVTDLGELVCDHAPLIEAFAKSRGIGLCVDAALGRAHVALRPRLFGRRLTTLVLALLHARDEAEQPLRASVRMHVRADRVELRCAAAPVTSRDADALLRMLGAALAEGCATAPAAPPRVVRRARAVGIRLRPSHELLTAPAERAADPPARARVLLLGTGEPYEDELEELLRDSGYVVLRNESGDDYVSALESSAVDVALVDAVLLGSSAGLLARVLEDPSCGRARVVVLGDLAGLVDLPTIPNPCPPDALLAAVEAACA